MAVIERNDRTNVPGRAELVDSEPAGLAQSAPFKASAAGDRTAARAIGVIAFLCAGAALWAGQKFMIPLVSGIMLAMLVAPVVAGLVRIIRLEFLSVVLTLLTVIAISVAAVTIFSGHITRVVDRVPDMIRACNQALTRVPIIVEIATI